MLERRRFARRHRSSSLSPFFLLQAPSEATDRSLPARVHTCTAYVHACVRACGRARVCWHIEERMPTHVRTHARSHSCGLRLILFEATDAPISARVSFVIRENVNQSPGPRRLLLLRASSLLFHLPPNSRMCTCACVCVYVRIRRLTILPRSIRIHVCV